MYHWKEGIEKKFLARHLIAIFHASRCISTKATK